MKKAKVYNFGQLAGVLTEAKNGFLFRYNENYANDPISLTMPIKKNDFFYETFPPFFDGLLPEGNQLEALLKQTKIDRNDYLSQLIEVGQDLVGSVTVKAYE